jgi:hypothetical protein
MSPSVSLLKRIYIYIYALLQVAKLGNICFIKSYFHKIILKTFFLLKKFDGKYVLIIKKLVLFLKKYFLLLF